MNYLSIMKEYDDMRVINRKAFKMDQIYQFKLEKYIHYYDYDLCEEKSDEYSEGSDREDNSCDDRPTLDIDQPIPHKFAHQHSGHSPKKEKNASFLSRKVNKGKHTARLPRVINDCLDEFSLKMA